MEVHSAIPHMAELCQSATVAVVELGRTYAIYTDALHEGTFSELLKMLLSGNRQYISMMMIHHFLFTDWSPA